MKSFKQIFPSHKNNENILLVNKKIRLKHGFSYTAKKVYHWKENKSSNISNSSVLTKPPPYQTIYKEGGGLWCLTPLSTILLVEETRGPRENHRPASSHWQTIWCNVVLSKPIYNEKQILPPNTSTVFVLEVRSPQLLISVIVFSPIGLHLVQKLWQIWRLSL